MSCGVLYTCNDVRHLNDVKVVIYFGILCFALGDKPLFELRSILSAVSPANVSGRTLLYHSLQPSRPLWPGFLPD
jgi:hypothetical protein